MIVLKTDLNKELVAIIPSKFENTQDNEYELNAKWYKGGKVIPDLLMVYWLDKQIVSCKWKHQVKPNFASNNEFLVSIPGLTIQNNRKE